MSDDLCRRCGFRPPKERAKVCSICSEEIGRELRRSVGRMTAFWDQVTASCQAEGREPTDEEWAKLREVVGVDEDGNEI